MISVVVRVKVAPGKMVQALEWSAKTTAYVKEAGLGEPPSVLRPITGATVHEFFALTQYPSMSEFEEAYRKKRADPGWRARLKEMGESDWYLDNTRRIFDVVE